MDCSMPGPLSITNPQGLKFMSIESVMPSNHFILCRPLLLLPSIFPSIRTLSNESALHIRWPKYWSFRFSISLSNEYAGLIPCSMDLFLDSQFYSINLWIYPYSFIDIFFLLILLAVLGLYCCARLSLVVARGWGYSSLWCTGFSLQWSCLWSTALGTQASVVAVCGLSSGSTWTRYLQLAGSRVWVQ